MTKKFHIAKNSVQETLIVPLYGRKLCSELFPKLYSDTSAQALCQKLDYDFAEQEVNKQSVLYQFGALEVAMRQLDLASEISDYLQDNPKATIVNLGCGLDQTGRFCDNGQCHIINIDLPDVIELRNQLIPAGQREVNLAFDLKNHQWIQQINSSNGLILFAAGVFHYFKASEVQSLIEQLIKHHSTGRLIFDTVGKIGLKLMLSQTLKKMNIRQVNGYFHLNHLKNLQTNTNLTINQKDYMNGYYQLKNYSIRPIHRLLASVSDRLLKMRIIKINF